MYHCRRLAHLEVNENELIRVPDRLAPSLRHLSLKNNKIIFCSLPRNHKFDHLELTENPFSMRPSHVVTLPNIKFVPKLQELASRNYLKLGFLYNKKIMAQYLCDYLDKAIYCPCSNVSWYFNLQADKKLLGSCCIMVL